MRNYRQSSGIYGRCARIGVRLAQRYCPRTLLRQTAGATDGGSLRNVAGGIQNQPRRGGTRGYCRINRNIVCRSQRQRVSAGPTNGVCNSNITGARESACGIYYDVAAAQRRL